MHASLEYLSIQQIHYISLACKHLQVLTACDTSVNICISYKNKSENQLQPWKSKENRSFTISRMDTFRACICVDVICTCICLWMYLSHMCDPALNQFFNQRQIHCRKKISQVLHAVHTTSLTMRRSAPGSVKGTGIGYCRLWDAIISITLFMSSSMSFTSLVSWSSC